VDFACELARALVPHLGTIAARKAKKVFAEASENDEKVRNECKKKNKKTKESGGDRRTPQATARHVRGLGTAAKREKIPRRKVASCEA
jgi:hypothetical protein